MNRTLPRWLIFQPPHPSVFYFSSELLCRNSAVLLLANLSSEKVTKYELGSPHYQVKAKHSCTSPSTANIRVLGCLHSQCCLTQACSSPHGSPLAGNHYPSSPVQTLPWSTETPFLLCHVSAASAMPCHA